MNPVAILLRAGCLLLTLPLLCAPQNANSRIDQLYQQGVEAAKQSDFAAAERAYRAGLEAAQSSDNKVWTARLHRSLAEVREARREWKDAAAEYTQALALYEELGDKSGANAVSMSLARGWAGVSDHSKSIEYANHALAGYLALSESANAAKALDIMGQEHAKNSQYGDAERALTQAVSLYEKLNDERGKGKVLGSLADLDRRTSRFNSALDNGFRALDTDEKFADHQEIAKVLDVLGTAFLDMGQYENARHYFERGLEERRRFGLSQHLSFSYRNMCAALFYSDNYAEAVDYCRKSLQEGMNAGNFREIAGSTLNIGISELQLGRMGDARHDLEQALAISEEHAYRQQEGSALYNLGNLSRTAGDLDKSLEYHQRALEVREQDRDRRAVVRSLSRIGLVLEERGDLQGALAAHERALAQFESIGGEISDPVQYGAFRQTSVGLYPHYARVLVKLGRTWDALLISERSRAVGLSRMVALNGAAFLDLLQHDHAETWRQASADLARAGNALRVAMERAQVQAEPTDGRTRAMEAARARYFEAQKRLSDLRDRLFASTPALRAAQNPAPPTAAQLQAMAKSSPDTLFLEWMIGRSIRLGIRAACRCIGRVRIESRHCRPALGIEFLARRPGAGRPKSQPCRTAQRGWKRGDAGERTLHRSLLEIRTWAGRAQSRAAGDRGRRAAIGHPVCGTDDFHESAAHRSVRDFERRFLGIPAAPARSLQTGAIDARGSGSAGPRRKPDRSSFGLFL